MGHDVVLCEFTGEDLSRYINTRSSATAEGPRNVLC